MTHAASASLSSGSDVTDNYDSDSGSDAESGSVPRPAGWWNKNSPSNMREIGSIQELVDALADAGDRLVIVDIFAPWCGACKALYPKLCKMMTEHEEDAILLKVNFEETKDMCKTMGIKVLPYFHLYRGGEGRVAAFSCTISKISRLKEAIDLYTAPFCSMEESPGIEEFPLILPHSNDQAWVAAHHLSHWDDVGPGVKGTLIDRPTVLSSNY